MPRKRLTGFPRVLETALRHLEPLFANGVKLTLVARTDDGAPPLVVTNDELTAVRDAIAAEAKKEMER
jgi:hypothetical protein